MFELLIAGRPRMERAQPLTAPDSNRTIVRPSPVSFKGVGR